jgi:hypothetical protein
MYLFAKIARPNNVAGSRRQHQVLPSSFLAATGRNATAAGAIATAAARIFLIFHKF